jgi:ElaA protein
MKIRWEWKLLTEMSSLEVYKVLQFRGKVFAVEQNEAYLDADGKDIAALHLLGWGKGDALIVYARVLLPSEADPFIRFGRLAVDVAHRGKGYGNQAVEQIFSHIMISAFSTSPIQISAQAHLVKMYEKFDFRAHGDLFNMGRIPHIKMNHPPLKKSLEKAGPPDSSLSFGKPPRELHDPSLFMNYKF